MGIVKQFSFRERQDLKKAIVKGPSDKDAAINDSILKERDQLKKELEEANAVYQDIQVKVNELNDLNEQLTDDNAKLNNSLQEALNELSELKQFQEISNAGKPSDQTAGAEIVPEKTPKTKKK